MAHTHTSKADEDLEMQKILQKNYKVGVEIHTDVNREEERSFSTMLPLT